jgi:hypothetical protein
MHNCDYLQVVVGGLPGVSARRTAGSLKTSGIKTNAKPAVQRAKCEAAGAPSCTPRSGFVQQIAAGNAGWRAQFRFAVHVIWSRVPELWTFAHSADRHMTKLALPAKLPMWELCLLKITRPEMRAMLGEPHFVETDSSCTFGGEEDGWGFTLPSGQRVVIVLRVPYHDAVFSADPPDVRPVLEAFGIRADDPRLLIPSEPNLIT